MTLTTAVTFSIPAGAREHDLGLSLKKIDTLVWGKLLRLSSAVQARGLGPGVDHIPRTEGRVFHDANPGFCSAGGLQRLDSHESFFGLLDGRPCCLIPSLYLLSR
jgi:hypothetical protein